MSRYRFAERARDDLEGIVGHILDESGPDRAEALTQAVFQALERLAAMPDVGHRREDLTEADLRFWPVFDYLVVYRPGTSPLEIARILHGARDVRDVLGAG